MMVLLLLQLLTAVGADSPCEDDPAFVDSYGESCSYWTGYCTPGMETHSFYTYILDGEEISVAGNLAGDVQRLTSGAEEIGGFNDGFGTYYSKDFWDGLRAGCPASCLQCEWDQSWWHDGNTPAFDGAELLPGYGYCRTEDDYATTANRDDCTQSRIDAGQCAIPSSDTMPPSKDMCVDAVTGVTDCYMACMADETCGCFSVSLDDTGAYATELGCFSLSGGAKGLCNLYSRANYDGTEVMWAKGAWGDIFYGGVGRRSYKMSPRAVTCKDCRTPPVRRRKLLFGTFHDDHDDHDMDMPCCPE